MFHACHAEPSESKARPSKWQMGQSNQYQLQALFPVCGIWYGSVGISVGLGRELMLPVADTVRAAMCFNNSSVGAINLKTFNPLQRRRLIYQAADVQIHNAYCTCIFKQWSN